MSMDILKKELKENKIRNVYLFYGPEEYLKKYYIDTITQQLLSSEDMDLNFTNTDGKIEADSVIQNCETLPVFCDKKVMIVKNSGLFKSEGKGAKGKLEEYLTSIPDYTCLIFVENEVDKRLKLVNSIKKSGLVVEFEYQKPADLVKWVIKVVKSHKKDIEPIAASYIVENSEYSMTELLNEINKLIVFVGEKKEISLDDATSVCTKSIKSRIFDLTDAVSEGNINKAMNLLNDMAAVREPMQKVLYMVIRQIRQIYRVKLLKKQSVPDSLIAKQLGLTPFIANKILNTSRNLDFDVVENAMQYALELDESIKSGKINDRIAVELLIVSMGRNG